MKIRILTLILFCIQFAFAENGKITFVIGKVELQKKGQSSWAAAQIDNSVSNGDRIRTRLQSRAEIYLPDESTLKIGENTVFEVKIVDSQKEEEYSFFLWLGDVSAKFKKLVSSRQSRTIESPSAVVAVRGTEFSMKVDQGRKTSVRVKSGRVEYKSKSTGKAVFVGANQSSSVEPGQDPTPPRETNNEDENAPPPENEDTGSEEDIQIQLNINMNKFVFTEPSIRAQGLQVSGTTNPGAQVSAGSAVAMADASGNFQLLVPVREGLNTINVSSKLSAQSTSSKLRVFINSEKPKLTIKRPVNSRYISLARYELEGAIDDRTPMDQVDLYVDQKLMGKFSAQSNFRVPVILKEGLNELTITARDRSGNVKQESETLFLDTIKPQIVIIKPAVSGKIINLPPNPPAGRQRPKTFIVSGRVLDPQPSSGLEKVSINGVSIQLSPNGQFELPIKLKLGVNQLIFIALDRAGNEQRVTRGIIVRRGN